MIPYGKQEITQKDIEGVIEVLKSDFLTQGPKVPEFEESIRVNVKAEFAYAVNSGTSALHISCLALGVGENDVVWTTPISFVASANCALYCGADIDFVDIDPISYNLSAEKLEEKLLYHKKNNLPLPKVVIPVHLCGQPCEMDKIHSLSKEYGFFIIEDASHAIGGKFKSNPIGNCQYSDLTVFSFHPVKIITTAEGGVVTTNNKLLAAKLELFRSHGITHDTALLENQSHGDWYYEQIALGFNYRMTDLQAALGISQMSRLHEFVERRNVLADNYDDLLKKIPIVLPQQHNDSYSARHLYVVLLELDKISVSRKVAFGELRAQGIGVNLHYIPIHTQPYYRQLGFKRGQFPNAESYYERSISIPLFYAMTEEQQSIVVEKLKTVLKSK